MYGEMPYMGSRLLKGFKKSPRCVMHRGLCYVESKFKKHLFFTFLPFYLFTFLPLKSTAGNSERSSDGCEEGDCNLQNRFPGICFHHLYYYF